MGTGGSVHLPIQNTRRRINSDKCMYSWTGVRTHDTPRLGLRDHWDRQRLKSKLRKFGTESCNNDPVHLSALNEKQEPLLRISFLTRGSTRLQVP